MSHFYLVTLPPLPASHQEAGFHKLALPWNPCVSDLSRTLFPWDQPQGRAPPINPHRKEILAQCLIPITECAVPSCAELLRSRTILCKLTDCSWPGSSFHAILQERIFEWVVIPFSRGSFQPRDPSQVSCIAGRFFTMWTTRGSDNTYT